jgi:4-amino-4-deoxy-L-arabinose transferase-like glycosyltransferase
MHATFTRVVERWTRARPADPSTRDRAAAENPQATLPSRAGLVAAGVLSATFIAIVVPVLGTLTHDFDEACLMLEARFILRGLRPFVDFPHHEMPLQLYLLALSGKLFGQTVFGYRMLSLLSTAGSGFLLFLLARPLVGPLPALVSQAVFLFSPVQVRALTAVPETPMLFFSLLGTLLLFMGRDRRAVFAAGVSFVVSLFIKPTSFVVVAAAVFSLAYAREWARLKDLAASGVLAAAGGFALAIYLSDGVLADIMIGQVMRVATRSANMWSFDSGFADMRRLGGIEKPWQWALVSFGGFYQSNLTLALFIVSLLALPIWVLRCVRSRPGLQAFSILWPAFYFALNFVALDFVSARYFMPYQAFSAFLVAGWVWLALRYLPSLIQTIAATVVCLVLVSALATTIGNDRDSWYLGRLHWIAQEYPSVLSFSPMFFAATGAEPACDFVAPVTTYREFGSAVLVTDRTRKFWFSDERLIQCLRDNPQTRVVIDWAFYFFARPGSALREYLAGEGRERRVFFSPDSAWQWDQPVLRISPLR